VDIDDMIMEPLASAEAVLTPEEKQDGVLLADIGGGTTDIAVFKNNTIFHTSVLPVAGYQVSRDISMGLGISFDLAEEMKKRYGSVEPVEENYADKDSTVVQDGHTVSYSDLLEIIRVRVEELLRLILLELPQTDYFKLIPSGIVLTGGGANLPGIAKLGEKVTKLPARVGYPVTLFGISDVLRDPAYATSVGLLLWKINNKETQAWQTKENNIRRLLSRVFRLFH
jgi:cell division protein FtsA